MMSLAASWLVLASVGKPSIVAVTDGAHRLAWKTDGTRISRFTWPSAAPRSVSKSETGVRWILIDTSLPKRSPPSVRIELLPSAPEREIGVFPIGRRWGVSWSGVVSGGQGQVRLGVASGPWRPAGSVTVTSRGLGTRQGLGFLRMARPFDGGNGIHTRADVAFPTDLHSRAYRGVAVDRHGKSWPANLQSISPNGDGSLFFTVPYDQIAKIVLQVRPYEWTAFPSVRFEPKRS